MARKAHSLFTTSIVLSLVLMTSGFSRHEPIDYAKPEHWLSLPDVVDKRVDVFYLYPTAWQKVNANDPSVCEIDNPSMMIGSGLAFGRQATAFEPVGNIYAPYYRQVDMTPSPAERTSIAAGIPTSDAVAAFTYYIDTFNNGRPFILAGHSQGSNVLVNLLSGYMKSHPEVLARMVVAYVVGYSVTEQYLASNPHLRFAQGANDAGVIVSYNTEAPDVVPGTNPVVLAGALAINPITWTRDETLAPASRNLGSILLNPDGSVVRNADGEIVKAMNYADARVDADKGVVICSTTDENRLAPGSATFGRGVYHSFDYPFYYYNIRDNAANRVENYFAQ